MSNKSNTPVSPWEHAAQSMRELADAMQEAIAAMWVAAEPTMLSLQKDGLLDENFQLTEKGKRLVEEAKK